jgi:eukaryotic-like serine/threonine-protein kinase
MRFAPWAVLLFLLAPPALAANDWPQFRYSETHQGLVPSSANSEFAPFKSSWWNNVSIPGPPGSPAVRENIAYYGDVNGKVWALDAESGGVIWTNTTSANPIVGAPAVGQDFVYAVNKGGSLYSFNRKTGQAQTGYPVSVGATDASPLFHETEDLLYVGSDSGTVQAYSPQGNYQKWSFTASGTFWAAPNDVTCSSGSIKGTPVVFGNQVMFGSTNGCFFGVNKTSIGTQSTPNWAFRALDSIRSTPVVDTSNSKVIFGDQSGNVYSIPVASSGKVTATPIYTEPSSAGVSSEIMAGAAIADGKLIIAARNGYVRALPLTGGTALWSQNLNGQVTSSPAVANGHVLVGSFDRKMYTLKLSDGSVEETRLALSEIETSPAISGTQGFWASKDGSLYSFGGTKPQRADLAVSGLSAGSPVRGQSASVSATIENRGVLPSEATVAKLYVGGTFASDTPVPALDPGATMAYSSSFVPASSGAIAVRLFVDASRTVRESDESNNDVTVSATVSEPPPPGATGSATGESKEPGIPGFDAFALLAALGAVAYASRRGAKR